MCTLLVLDRITPGFPLVVASNRDEFYARPSAPPARVDPQQDGQPPFVAPQDLEAGGTWMGVNAYGLFVGLTNRPPEERLADARSRGLLVTDALACRSAEEVSARLEERAGERYNPFHLLAADGTSACVLVGGEERWDLRALEPGIQVVCNRDPKDESSRKVQAIRSAAGQIDRRAGADALFLGLARLLGSHDGGPNPLESVCVHTPGYGTRSSTVLALGGERWRCWHAEGPPCETKYANLTRLYDEIREANWGEHH